MNQMDHRRIVAQRRAQEQQRQDDAVFVARGRHVLAGLKEEESWGRRRELRQEQEEYRERELESALLKAEEDRINKDKQLEQEEKMAKELARIDFETQREEKVRQHIKENSLELRELESKLKAAYMNKERAAQIAHHEAIKSEIFREKADCSRKMQCERDRAAEEQQKVDQKHQEELFQYQRGLGQQVVEREQSRQEAYEEFLKEKHLVDEIVRKVYEEDQMERQLKLEKVRATQQHIQEFHRQQAEWRRIEKERLDAENRRIMEFMNRQDNLEEDKKAKLRETEEAKDKLHKILCERMEAERQKREEMEQIRGELCLEEREEANRQREIEEMEKRMRERLTMQQACQEHEAFKQMRKKANKEEEEAFSKAMMAKYAEDDRIEQMNAQKRRMKQLEHKREVVKMIEDKRRQHLADVELEAKERAMEQEREAQRRQIVEEERKKLLKRHAAQLLGYFPKGLLREDDLQYFDEDFRNNFKPVASDDSWDGDA
ncbi:meiosis-specific nuclear structural protein 1 [Limanda limanda]|uniref:meiosis-specific nuclear structural protein 1 n=1 Tax=Limanda limanda TaxID=27771 RepID=UPI0029C71454|nr:meiosis-specific nuclear structural protein 1 [Limanda limanda]